MPDFPFDSDPLRVKRDDIREIFLKIRGALGKHQFDSVVRIVSNGDWFVTSHNKKTIYATGQWSPEFVAFLVPELTLPSHSQVCKFNRNSAIGDILEHGAYKKAWMENFLYRHYKEWLAEFHPDARLVTRDSFRFKVDGKTYELTMDGPVLLTN